MTGFAVAQGCDGNGGVEHVDQRRPRRRSATAEVVGVAALNSLMNRRTLWRVALAGGVLCAGFAGWVTLTGTIAAAGLPWRSMIMLFPPCSASSMIAER